MAPNLGVLSLSDNSHANDCCRSSDIDKDIDWMLRSQDAYWYLQKFIELAPRHINSYLRHRRRYQAMEALRGDKEPMSGFKLMLTESALSANQIASQSEVKLKASG